MAGTGTRASTTREAVVEAAVRLVDTEGLDALTMRRLAEAAGVGVMTLYTYVKTKDEVIEAVCEVALAQVVADTRLDVPWHEQLRLAMSDLYDTLQQHPGVVDLLVTQTINSAFGDRIREQFLGILREAGFADADAVDALSSLVAHALGYAVMQRTGQERRTPKALEKRLRSLPAEEYPHLSSAAAEYASHVSKRSFDKGLAHILNGLVSGLEAG
jgi:AcrR family transcriptional regulator